MIHIFNRYLTKVAMTGVATGSIVGPYYYKNPLEGTILGAMIGGVLFSACLCCVIFPKTVIISSFGCISFSRMING